jgi:HSP20 family protein
MAQWNPFEEMEMLRREVDKAFEGFGARQEPSRRGAFLPGSSPRRYPLVNLFEEQDKIYVEALTPGIDPESLNVDIVHNRLMLSGEKIRITSDVKPEAFHRSERASGKFVRTVELPVEIDERGVRAEYKHGVLLVTLPKAEKAKPKQISVKVE